MATSDDLPRWDSKTAVEGERYAHTHPRHGAVTVVAVRVRSLTNCKSRLLCRCGCGERAGSDVAHEGYAPACLTRERTKAAVAAARRPDGTLPPFKGKSKETVGAYCTVDGVEGKAIKNRGGAVWRPFCACGTCYRLTPKCQPIAAGCATAERCVTVVNGVRCKAGRERGDLCPSCYAKERYGTCPRCPLALAAGRTQCSACDAKDAVAAQRAAHVPELLALVAAGARDGREVKSWEAEKGVVHVVHNAQQAQRPRLVLRSGKAWTPACTHGDGRSFCGQLAVQTNDGTKTHCVAHGGGMRCSVPGVHEGPPPHAIYTFSASVATALRGQPACHACLVKLDPTNLAVHIKFHKEHLFLAAIAEELCKRLWGWLVCGATNIATHDCVAGPSNRRMDLMLAMARRFLVDLEGDEFEHVDRTTSCEHAKLAGHLIDAGLAGLTRSESRRDDVLYAEGRPSDAYLCEVEGTDADTEENAKLRAARRALNDRLVRSKAAAEAGGKTPKLRVLRVNLDGFTAADGTKVGSMFTDVHIQSKADVSKKKLSMEGLRAIPRIVDRLLEIYMQQLDDAYFEAHKSLEVEYLRYSGCDRDGVDRHGLALVEIQKREAGEREKRVADDVARREAFKAHAKGKKRAREEE